jgi:hypothetical protein
MPQWLCYRQGFIDKEPASRGACPDAGKERDMSAITLLAVVLIVVLLVVLL